MEEQLIAPIHISMYCVKVNGAQWRVLAKSKTIVVATATSLSSEIESCCLNPIDILLFDNTNCSANYGPTTRPWTTVDNGWIPIIHQPPYARYFSKTIQLSGNSKKYLFEAKLSSWLLVSSIIFRPALGCLNTSSIRLFDNTNCSAIYALTARLRTTIKDTRSRRIY